jgi:cytochrome c
VIGRDAGAVSGFRYSAGFADAKFRWDEQKLDAWLADPQAMISGAIMPYKQAKPEIRTAIVSYLKELH